MDIRPQAVADREFLIGLFAQCSPMRDFLTGPLLRRQAQAQIDSHQAQHPLAMARIVLLKTGEDQRPIGRIVIDWDCDGLCHGVDIAVLPGYRRTGAALHMLRAWLEVADGLGCASSLDVVADNPALRIYARLGFVPLTNDDPYAPVIAMRRPAAKTAA